MRSAERSDLPKTIVKVVRMSQENDNDNYGKMMMVVMVLKMMVGVMLIMTMLVMTVVAMGLTALMKMMMTVAMMLAHKGNNYPF